jgi:hypothetical protein
MGMTILEAAKSSDMLTQGIVEIFAKNNPVLQVLPFDDIEGGGLKYDTEESLPGIGFRGVNEGYEPSIGVINPAFEPLVIAGGELDVDNHILRTQGESRRVAETSRKVRALSLKWGSVFIKGDAITNPRQFDGLQARLVSRQVLAAGSSSGGDPVSLFKLDELASLVEGENKYYIMNTKMKLRMSQAARNSDVGGHVEYTVNNFGQRIMSFNGIPILELKRDNLNNDILPFTEAATTGPNTACSIYCASFDDEHVSGIQSGPVQVEDLGDLKSLPVQRTRVEWDCGLVVRHPWAAARLWACSDAAFVV